MLKEDEILNLVRQNVQMGIDGIKLVIDDTDDKDFYIHHALTSNSTRCATAGIESPCNSD